MSCCFEKLPDKSKLKITTRDEPAEPRFSRVANGQWSDIPRQEYCSTHRQARDSLRAVSSIENLPAISTRGMI